MEAEDEVCSPAVNGAYPVRSTEEVLLPFFTDESLPVAMHLNHPPASHAVPPQPLELRLVLLGRKGAGKSAAGNTVLGGGFESGRPTEECVKGRADVAGRNVMVVDTPGWEWYYPLNRTPNWVRRETLRSVSLCPPGPHAVLLVVRSCASVTEAYISEIEEHLEPLGKAVWDHIMLLFTRGDELGLVSMQQRILSSGPALKKLLQKCRNRYHVINNLSKGDGTQVKELMRKLEEMVDGGSYLEMNHAVLLDLEADRTRRARERRKKQRQMEAQMQRGTIKAALMGEDLQASQLDAHHSFSKTPRRLQEVRLVLLGERETGKSSAGNTILGDTRFFQVGTATEECIRHQAEVAKRQVTVVDTPGWEGGVAGTTPERVQREIVGSVALCPPGPHAILLTLRVDMLVRAGHVREHLELLGEGVWRHTILLFTHGDQLRQGVDIQQYILGGGKDMHWLLDKCRRRYHVIGSGDGGGSPVSLLDKVEAMAAANRCEAFSDLVLEVRNLSQQRNERFNQRLKDMSDKMLRQEVELKNMREREMRSIRWFFDRKKKTKPAGKADVQREEEEDEDRTTDERKNDIGELEERIRWLTEDKEKEIQDLSIENERIRVALNQSTWDGDRAMLQLQLKEHEIQELNERIDEHQVKLLGLECASTKKEQERKQRENAIRREYQERMKESVEHHEREKAAWMDAVDSLRAEAEELKRLNERQAQETELKLLEKDKATEELMMKASGEKQRACEEDMARKVEEMKSQHLEEIERKMREKEAEIRDLKQQHRDEMARKISQLEKVMESRRVEQQEEVEQLKEKMGKNKQKHADEMRDMHEKQQREMREIKEQIEKDVEQQMQARERELEQDRLYMQAEMQEAGKEKEGILVKHKKEVEQKLLGKEKEVEALKLQHQDEMARKANEVDEVMAARRVEMEEEMDRKVRRVREEYGGRIREMERERERATKELTEEFTKQRRAEIEELERKHAAEIEERRRENQKEKGTMIEKHRRDILKEMKDRDKQIEALKCQHVHELEEKMQKEKEKLVLSHQKQLEESVKEKEKEIEELKFWVEEVRDRLEEKDKSERSYFSCKEETEQRLKEKERQVEAMTEDLKELERKLRETEEEREQERQSHKEKEQEMEKLIHETQQRKEEERERLLKDMESKVREKDREMQRVQQGADSREARWREEQRKKDQRAEKEINRLAEISDINAKDLARVQCCLAEKDHELHRAAGTLIELDRLRGRAEQEARKEAELAVKEEEINRLRQRDKDNEKEVAQLRLTIEQTKAELKELTDKMEAEMTCMIEGYEEELERKNKSFETVAKQKDGALRCLEEKYKESQTRVEELQELKERMRKEADELVKGREREAEEKLATREQEVKRRQEELRKRGLELDAKEGTLGSNEEILRRREASLEEKQKELEERHKRSRQKKEQELEGLLRALEGKQEELSVHGRDLQRKLRGLKDQGRELNDRESFLRKEERELLNWKSELQVQNQHVTTTTQQLDEMGRGLALLKEELRGKEANLKTSLKKLRAWQLDLEEREAELSRRKRKDVADGRCLMYQEVSVGGEEEREGRRGGRERKQVQTDDESYDSPCETAPAEVQEEARKKDSKEQEGSKVIREVEVSSRGPGGELRVMVLGECWSSRSPAGVTILGGEAAALTSSGFRPWRGQVAGRHLVVVEPLGLRWRDGPGNASLLQRSSILESLTWCHPGPQVVLLLVPAFITCTQKYRRALEEHVGLLGGDAWQRCLLVCTWGETLGERWEQHILRNGELAGLVERCGGRFHVLTSRGSRSLTEALVEKMEDMVALNSRDNHREI